MNRRNLTLFATVLVVGLAVVPGNAWAQTIVIPNYGTETVTTVDPGRQFTDADGITHYRGLIQASQIVGQDADGVTVTGTAVYVNNINIDMVTGDGDISVKMSTESTYGDLSGAWRGSAALTITGFVFDGSFNYSRGSGDFDGWHWQGSISGVFGGTENLWDADFHIPGGGKAAATEAETWSDVKSLFR